MKHNLKRVLRLTEARTFWVRAVRAWRNLLPDWTPTLDELRKLESMPHEHRAAVAVVAEGWESNDPRWDVLMALLEWERREAREAVELEMLDRSIQPLPEQRQQPLCLPGECTWPDCVCPESKEPSVREVVIPFKVTTRMGQVLQSGETTVQTPIKAHFLDALQPVKHLREKTHE